MIQYIRLLQKYRFVAVDKDERAEPNGATYTCMCLLAGLDKSIFECEGLAVTAVHESGLNLLEILTNASSASGSALYLSRTLYPLRAFFGSCKAEEMLT